MGLLSGLFGGNKGYSLHVKANRLSEAGTREEAKAMHDQAMAEYQKAIDKGVRVPRDMLAYGVLLLRAYQFQRAHDLMLLTEKTPGITRDEKNQLRINYAICEWKLGRLDKAIDLMNTASQDHKTSMIYGSLGYMLIEKARQTGDFSEAIRFNNEAMEYDDDDAVVLDNMGQLHLAMGERDKALEYFRKAHEKKPGQVDTLFYLGKMNLEDGKPEKAREYLRRAVDGNYTALCTTTREQAQQLLDSVG